MESQFVRDTVVASAGFWQGGELWKRLEIVWADAAFQPGQYVMLAGRGVAMNWPHPLMIQQKTARGIDVLVTFGHPLFDLAADDAVTMWGPSGKGLPAGGYSVVTDNAGLPLVTPLLLNRPAECHGIWLMDAKTPMDLVLLGQNWQLQPYGDGLWESGFVVAALPLAEVAALQKKMPGGAAGGTYVYVGAKIGCGTGACRGCHIHNPRFPHGLPVCQEGPFLPMAEVDYKQDQNFLTHYMSGGMV